MASVNLDWGYIELGNNEVSVVSTVEDPPAVRLASLSGKCLGKVSFSRLRTDGVQEEIVLLQGKVDERDPDSHTGEFTIHIRREKDGLTDDQQMVHVVTFRHDQLLMGPSKRVINLEVLGV